MTSASRETLLQLLEGHLPTDDKERADLMLMKAHARALAQPFARGQPEAHFTGSAMVVSADGKQVCLVHHLKLGRWLQPGGHCEPEDGGDMCQTALREAREETGLTVALHPQAPRPLDVDVHRIPARKDELEHLHLDVRFLVVARWGSEGTPKHDPLESHGAAWLTWEEAMSKADEPAMRRLLEKSRNAVLGGMSESSAPAV